MSKVKLLILSLLFASTTFFAKAEEAKWLEVEEKMVLDFPASDVWGLIEDYNGMTKWHPSIARSDIIEGVNNVVGANRRLILLNGLELDERLTIYDPTKMIIQYDINKIAKKLFPISEYVATLQVISNKNNQSTLLWKSRFKRKDQSENPSETENDKAGIDTIKQIYRVAFDGIKKNLTDKKAIYNLLERHGKAGTDGNKQLAESTFEKNGSVKFIKDNEIVDLSATDYVRNRMPNGKQDRTFKIDFIDIKQDVASAKMTSDYKTHQFVNYFTLIKYKGEWYIVSKIFARIEKPIN